CEWKRWQETDRFVDEALAAACSGNAFAAGLASGLPRETGTRFKVWIDHLVLKGDRALTDRVLKLGYARQPSTYAVGVPLFAHSGGIFPPIAVTKGTAGATNGARLSVAEVAIKVESVAAFSRAHDLGLDV